METNIAVVLSGCGVFDGAEIHESVMTLLHIDLNGSKYQCFAPDKNQVEVINHLSKKQTTTSRNILHEAARIARGDILPLEKLDINNFDALIIPGGLGSIKNLSNFASKGKDLTIDEGISKIIHSFFEHKKPIGLICISPVLAGKIFPKNTIVTIGNDLQTIAPIEAMGLSHKICNANEIVVDLNNKLVTTPAYMLAKSIKDVYEGVGKLVSEVIRIS
jgi:enhancing lycopene biosynthesis protein 2